MAIMRLDKFLSHMGYGTRKEVKDLIKKGLVEIDGKPIKKPETKVADDTTVYVEGIPLNYVQYEYYLLNKTPRMHQCNPGCQLSNGHGLCLSYP